MGEARGHRRDVQGLRAVAVLAVMGSHVLDWPRAGFVGVDVFFVISGYVITGLLLREQERTGRVRAPAFYRRRAKRILPAAVLVLAVTVAAASVLTPGARLRSTAVDAAWASGFAANWRFALEDSAGVGLDELPSPLRHYWSLGVEEQFYLLWPWLVLALFALAVRFGGSGLRARWLVGAVIALGSVVSFAYAVRVSHDSPNWAYFTSLARVWELGAGAVVAVLAGSVRPGPKLGVVLAWTGLAGVVGSLFVVEPGLRFPAPWGALPVLSTALLLAIGGSVPERVLWPLTNRVAHYLGDTSYSLYLWHFPIAILLLSVMTGGTVAYDVVALVLIAAASFASFHLVEDPLRRTTWWSGRPLPALRVAHRRAVLGVAAAVAAAAAVCGVLAVQVNVAVAGEAPGGVSSDLARRTPCLGAAALDAACAGARAERLYPSPQHVGQDLGQAFEARCWMKRGDRLKSCRFGRADGVRVALVGDSHAATLLPALRAEADEAGWRVDTFTGVGCRLSTTTYRSCSSQAQLTQRLLTGDRYDVILTTASRTATLDAKADASAYAAAWRPLLARGTRLVVVADNPEAPQVTLLCVQRRGFRLGDHCATPRARATSAEDPMVMAAGIARVPVVDLLRYYCGAQECPAVIGGVQVYRDAAGHVTASYMRTLAPYLVERIQAAIR